jgi:protein O-mannosyl-transferase
MTTDKSQPFITHSGGKRTILGVCILLALAVFLVFGQTLRYGFVNLDDRPYVYENAHVAKGLTLTGIVWAFTRSHAGYWHPLTWISHMLDCQFYGLNAGGHHLTNVLIHAATAILLFLVLRQMTGTLWPSAFVAAVFAIHPLRVESVAWVAERKDVLSGLFFMLTLLMYARYVEQSKVQSPKSKVFYGLVLLFFALGLMSKPMLVTLPFVLLLLDWWPLNRFEPTTRGPQPATHQALRLVREKTPLFLLAAVSCVMVFLTQKGTGAMVTIADIPLTTRLSNAMVSYGAYIVQMLWPANLAVFYPYRPIPVWQVMSAGAWLLLITLLTVMFARRLPYLLVGWFWYLGMLVPVIGIIQVGQQARADRFTYLPQIGLCLAIAWTVKDLSASWRYRRALLRVGAFVVIIALTVCAGKQTSYWRDSESLWTHALACTPDNAIAENHLGAMYATQGRLDAAIQHYQKALEIEPNNFDVYNNLANVLVIQRKIPEAIAHYKKALEIRPDYTEAQYNLGVVLASQGRVSEALEHYQKAIQLNPDWAEAHYNLGVVFGLRGQLGEAVEQFQKAVELKPDYADAHGNLAKLLATRGKLDEAVKEYQRTLELVPGSAQAHFRFGQALQAQHRFAAAKTEYQKALELDPKQLPAHLDLAWLLATCPETSLRDGNRAVELAQQVERLSQDGSPHTLDTLAAAYAEAGRFGEAVETAKRALNLNATQNNQPLAEAIQSRLKLYEANAPYHEKP